jgi:hypothetical protein
MCLVMVFRLKYKWARPEELKTVTDPHIMVPPLNSDDIKQGAIGKIHQRSLVFDRLRLLNE